MPIFCALGAVRALNFRCAQGITRYLGAVACFSKTEEDVTTFEILQLTRRCSWVRAAFGTGSGR